MVIEQIMSTYATLATHLTGRLQSRVRRRERIKWNLLVKSGNANTNTAQQIPGVSVR